MMENTRLCLLSKNYSYWTHPGPSQIVELIVFHRERQGVVSIADIDSNHCHMQGTFSLIELIR